MISAFIEVLGTALSIWDSKEKTKYVDRLLALEKKYYEEENKPEAERSQAVLDNLAFEVRQLARAFVLEARKG